MEIARKIQPARREILGRVGGFTLRWELQAAMCRVFETNINVLTNDYYLRFSGGEKWGMELRTTETHRRRGPPIKRFSCKMRDICITSTDIFEDVCWALINF